MIPCTKSALGWSRTASLPAFPLLLWLLVVGSFVVQAAPSAAHAVDLLPMEAEASQPEARKVAVLPFRVQQSSPAELFAPDTPKKAGAAAEALESVLTVVLQRQPLVEVQTVADVRRALADLPGSVAQQQTALQQYRIGLDLYLSLATTRAATALRNAVQLYRALWQDVIDPRPYADAQFMLGVTLIDLERSAEGHIALKDGFGLQPERRFRNRFFPPAVEQALTAALVDHNSTLDPLHPYGDHARLHQLARQLGVAWLVTGVVYAPQGSPAQLYLAVYSAQRRTLETELAIPLAEVLPTPEGQLDAFVSRWLACAPPRMASPRAPPPEPTLRLDTSAAYAPFLRQPTRAAFHSLGFAAGASGPIRDSLDWHARAQLYTSVADPYRDLLFSFNSVRLIAGAGFAGNTGPMRWFFRPGVDIHALGQFVASTDPDCKLFGRDHPLCGSDSVLDLEQSVLIGVNLAAGGHLALGRSFFLSLQSSLSVYFLPLDGTDRLNYPLSAELGFGYRL